MTPDPATRWTIIGIPGLPRLNVELVVATTAPAVVSQIEFAAEEAGVVLVRVEEES
jgi:hypothetical protein